MQKYIVLYVGRISVALPHFGLNSAPSVRISSYLFPAVITLHFKTLPYLEIFLNSDFFYVFV